VEKKGCRSPQSSSSSTRTFKKKIEGIQSFEVTHRQRKSNAYRVCLFSFVGLLKMVRQKKKKKFVDKMNSKLIRK